MKRKISLLISALCALGTCASFTACMTDNQNGKDENIEKTRTNTNIVEQQNEENDECPDGNCPTQRPEFPDIENMPPMPEFRFMPHPEHMPNSTNTDENTNSENADDKENDNENNSDTPDENKKPHIPAPHRGGKIKPKMPKKGN